METTAEAKSEPRGMLVLRTLAMPKDTNPWGDVFGGWLLSQMDIAAGLMAGEVAKGRSATVAVDQVVFRSPVSVGQTVCIYAELTKVGRTSMEIRLEVWARDLVHRYEDEHEFVAEGVFHYVAVDAEGRARRIEDNPPFFTR
jgi:acyl-CoA thioesterase YciA